MLPDSPEVKADLAKRFNDFLQGRTDEYLGPLSKISRLRYFEGDGHALDEPRGTSKGVTSQW